MKYVTQREGSKSVGQESWVVLALCRDGGSECYESDISSGGISRVILSLQSQVRVKPPCPATYGNGFGLNDLEGGLQDQPGKSSGAQRNNLGPLQGNPLHPQPLQNMPTIRFHDNSHSPYNKAYKQTRHCE